MSPKRVAAPLTLYETTIRADWIDDFDHMNVANYVLVCDSATYAFWEYVNGGRQQKERGGAEYAVAETHVNYLREVRLGDPVRVTTQLLGADEKRFRLFHTLHHASEDYVSATNEVMALGFDLNQRRILPFSESVQASLQDVLAEHASLPCPANAGHGISMRKR